MHWEQMTIDEYAIFQRANGTKVVKINGVWWVEIRPFFFRPLLPYAAIYPNSKQYPLKSLIGGFQHVVPSGVAANSHLNFFFFDELQGYSFNKLSDKRKNAIRKGLKNFSVKQIDDVAEFINDAYDIYVAFYNRTKYSYQKKRLNRIFFSSWAETLFDNPKILIIGAYHDNKLSAVNISYLVEEVIFYATFFSSTQSLQLQVTDFMIHIIREAAASSNAKYIFMGMPSGKRSLDKSKTMRGCKLFKMPAYYKINPIALFVARVFMKNSYNKLIGVT
jgi:hypothetical protein